MGVTRAQCRGLEAKSYICLGMQPLHSDTEKCYRYAESLVIKDSGQDVLRLR
jgi:hypothetical protein